MSSKGIEPFAAINQFFYREPPLPIGSPALKIYFIFEDTWARTRTLSSKGRNSTNRVLSPKIYM